MIEKDWDSLVGANVQRLRVASGLSQTDLADRLGAGFRQQTILKIEKGTRPLKLSEGVALSKILDIPVEGLYIDPEELLMTEEALRARTRLQQSLDNLRLRRAEQNEAEAKFAAAQEEMIEARKAFDQLIGPYMEDADHG